MSNNTIRETIDAAVREQVGSVPMGYERVVEAVKVAVEGLADSAVESLQESGRALGATDQQLQDAFVAAGLVEVEPEPEDIPEPETVSEDSNIETRVGKIEAAVERLTALAERHLGRLG